MNHLVFSKHPHAEVLPWDSKPSHPLCTGAHAPQCPPLSGGHSAVMAPPIILQTPLRGGRRGPECSNSTVPRTWLPPAGPVFQPSPFNPSPFPAFSPCTPVAFQTLPFPLPLLPVSPPMAYFRWPALNSRAEAVLSIFMSLRRGRQETMLYKC